MNWNGTDQFKVVTAENASGKLSWSPDGKSVAFCRYGMVDLKGPDHLGGKHKVWDIFIGFLDSARGETPNTNWWRRDGKSVAFCRHGMVDLKGPDHLGGKHKVWDIFIGFLDSAQGETPNTNWWRRVTFDLGGR